MIGAHCPSCYKLVVLSRGIVEFRCPTCGGPARADDPPYEVVWLDDAQGYPPSSRTPALFTYTGAGWLGPDWARRFLEWERYFWDVMPRGDVERLSVPWDKAWQRLLKDPVARGAVFAAQALVPTQGLEAIYQLAFLLANEEAPP